MSHIITIIRINDTLLSRKWHHVAQYENRFPLNWWRWREANSQTDCNKIKYESDLWLYNRNLMKTIFRLLSIWLLCVCELWPKFSNFIRLRRFDKRMLLWSNQRSFFSRFHVILIRLSYSDHVAYISFIFLLPSLLPFAMKSILFLLDEKSSALRNLNAKQQ